MSVFKLKPTHAPVKTYYETLEKFGLPRRYWACDILGRRGR
jgi:hypothetical protein